MKDENIPGTVVRTSTIPEELGRLVYLLTDKTGTPQPAGALGTLARGRSFRDRERSRALTGHGYKSVC